MALVWEALAQRAEGSWCHGKVSLSSEAREQIQRALTASNTWAIVLLLERGIRLYRLRLQ